MYLHLQAYFRFCILFVGLFLCSSLFSQRNISATRTNESITIDGKLDESIWQTAEVASDFTVWQPEPGTKPSNKSEFRIAYDDNALYIGAYLHATSRDEIKTELTQRDDVGNTDWIGVIIDTYGSGNDGAEFILSATGVQFDARITTNSGEDTDWNEVWYSDVILTEKGWTAEIKIPYFALRFPKKKEQSWKINLMRKTAFNGQKSSFEFIDPEVQGFVNQSATLTGISNIKPPLRLSLSPYMTTYVQHSKDGENSSTGFSYNGGLDLKYGINDAFTLDMTLVPDFGQVQSDDQVLNLSPFEVQFSENRAFFTEGLDLFGRAGLFYSRRVGGAPLASWRASHNLASDESVTSNPNETQLYNATKVSGRTKNGLGVGVFNAIAGATHATVRNNKTDEVREVETSPLTNYNIVVLDQNLPNNSYISLINTNVNRFGDGFHSANVTGTEFDIKTKKQDWGIFGGASFSQLLNPGEENDYGLRYNASINKISGNFRLSFSTSGTSQKYNHNDLGFFTRSNIRNHNIGARYMINKGWKSFSRINFWFNTSLQTTYEENKFSSLHLNSGFWAQSKGLWEFNMWTNYEPESIDFFEPRNNDYVLKRPGFYNLGWWIGSDSRKKFRISFNPFYMKMFEKGAYIWEFYIGPRYRFSDKFTIYAELGVENFKNFRGFVDTSEGIPIIGRRDLRNFENVLGFSYTFNEKMSLTFRARHDWSNVTYEGDFSALTFEGDLINTDYNQLNDFSINFFNIDMVYTWRFAPGSDIIFVWKNSIQGGENDPTIDFTNRTYIDGLKQLGELPQRNSVSLRLVYFFNAQTLFK